MKYILTLLILSGFLNQQLFAQPSPAEINKMMKDAKAEIEKMKKDPKNAELMKSMPNMDSVMKKMPKGNISTSPNKTTTNLQAHQFPEKNKLLLASIPKNIFTQAELVSYCNVLYKQLSAKIDPAKIKAVNAGLITLGENAYKLNLAAVASWYNGAPEEALLMAIKGVTLDPGYDVLLNNVAAMLNLGGLEYKAIPILKILLEKYPDNPMVLNNMGQAYAGLGATDTAMIFFAGCIRHSPNHPEANNTAGQIELAKGNKEKAKNYFEHSLAGAYSESSSNGLFSIDRDANLLKYIRPHVHIPEYFNADKYHLPQQCENIGQAAFAKEEYDAYKEMLGAQIKKYRAIEIEEHKIAEQTVREKLLVGVNQNHEAMPPFFFLAGAMLAEINNEKSIDILALDKFNNDYNEQYHTLEIKYQEDRKKSREQFKEREEKQGEGNPDVALDDEICKVDNNLANAYLKLFSDLTKDWQIKNLAINKKYLDEIIYWSYLLSIDIHNFRDIFYSLVVEHLTTLQNLCQTKIMYPCHRVDADKQTADSLQIKEPDCPVEFEIKFIVGKFKLDCKKVSFSGGEGFVFKYEKNFSSRQSTMSLGIGAQLELGGGFGGVSIGAGAGANESLFIKFDGNNRVTDAGLKFDVHAGTSADSKFNAGKVISVNKDLSTITGLDHEISMGYTVGMESGWNFNEGPLKNLLNTTETQVNKNVPVYKTGN